MSVTVSEVYQKAGLKYIESENVEKSMEDLHKEITDLAIKGNPEAYQAYDRMEHTLADSRVKIAKAEIKSVMEEYDRLLSRDIRKSDESEAGQECRVWIENNTLYIRFQNAQRLLDEIR